MTLRVSTWTLEEVAQAVAGELVGEPSLSPTLVSSDTRTIRDGALFVALSGERFDGHDYVADALQAGATAALVSRRVDVPIAQIVVDDTLAGLQRLGAALFRQAREAGVFSIALTGSNGKTTTKELLAALWSTVGRTHATRGNLNNHIGLPLTLCAMPLDTEVLVLEMGANRPGDIRELIEIAPTDVRVVTSIGAAHIEGFGGIAGVRRTKAEIFDDASVTTAAVVPAAEAALVPPSFVGPRVTVGEGGDVQFARTDGAVRVSGAALDLTLETSLPGEHNAHNLATAVATFAAANRPFDPELAKRAVATLTLPGGRWREVRHGEWTFLDDAYNANPSSVRASWDAFVEIQERDEEVTHVVAIIGEMFELGTEARTLHCETARWVCERGGAAAFAFVGSHSEAMAEAAGEVTSAEVHAFEAPQDAAQWLRGREPGTVYLKASRGQKLESLIESIQQYAPSRQEPDERSR